MSYHWRESPYVAFQGKEKKKIGDKVGCWRPI
jgi:hypothetical protein